MRLAVILFAAALFTATPVLARSHNPSSHECYRSSDGSEVHGPTTKANAAYGRVTADCRDGTHSYSHHPPGHARGTAAWLSGGRRLAVLASAPYSQLMCGRFASILPAEFVARLFGTVNQLPNAAPTWNFAPSQDSMVVRRHPGSGEHHLDLLRWGLIPYFTKDPKGGRKPINARAETVATSGMFRDAFAMRRCIVPAAAFYEWRKMDEKQPFAFARQDGQPLAFAGLWEGWCDPDGQALRTFLIITTAANEVMRPIHDRMPVVLEPEDPPAWLGEQDGDPSTLLRPPGQVVLRAWSVSPLVNSPRNDSPDLLEPVELPVA